MLLLAPSACARDVGAPTSHGPSAAVDSGMLYALAAQLAVALALASVDPVRLSLVLLWAPAAVLVALLPDVPPALRRVLRRKTP